MEVQSSICIFKLFFLARLDHFFIRLVQKTKLTAIKISIQNSRQKTILKPIVETKKKDKKVNKYYVCTLLECLQP